ncbi:hypothetical protein BGZ73_001648 [Actinomortierella ambigua]|nr:hypothetical protein BGZ73_001648 [Actinomortierella ambigua]
MQEIEVPPRDVFQHLVHVDQLGKTLVWWFSTKKKNISFGLYYRQSSSPDQSLPPTQALPSIVNSKTTTSATAAVTSSVNSTTIGYTDGVSKATSTVSGTTTPRRASLQPASSPNRSVRENSTHTSSRNSLATTNSDDEDDLPPSSQPQQQQLQGDDEEHDDQMLSVSSTGHQHQQPRRGSAHTLAGVASQPSSRKKKTVAKFKDPDLVEILPIQHYDSGLGTIRGEHTVDKVGTYVLVFDNTFSINTSKRLTFFVAMEEQDVKAEPESNVDIAGWLLKKKRKKMQGWAKRWFQIDNGVLSYSKDPNGPCRGKVHLVLSTVTVTQASNMIHIDSGTMLYHLKTLTAKEYAEWTDVIKACKAAGQKAAHDTVHRIIQRENTQKRALWRQSWLASQHQLDELREIMSSMDTTFDEMKEQLDILQTQTVSTGNSHSNSTHTNGTGNISNGGGGHTGGSLAGSSAALLANRERQMSMDASAAASAASPASSSGRSKFRLPTFGLSSIQRTQSDSCVPTISVDALYEKLQASYAKLKADKERAFEIMQAEMNKWEKNEKQFMALLSEQDACNRPGSDGDGHGDGLTARGGASIGASNRLSLSQQALEEAFMEHARKSFSSERSNSLTSSVQTGSDVFFDAIDEPVLTANLSANDLSDLEQDGFDGQRGSVDDDDDDDEDDDADSSDNEDTPAPQPASSIAAEVVTKAPTDPLATAKAVVRRTVLPAPVSGEEVSLLSVLRKNVGKDLSTVAMPVSMNEPINVLQRLCEELEYSELLDKAASLESSLDRMVLVATFAVSGYSTTQWRAARKPFNPLHGETFELVSPEKGFKYISEKVSHYPPIMACHAESIHGWTFSMDSRTKTKFWGKSMEIMPNSTIHIMIPKYGDHYTISKPSTWMRNLMAGTKYLEHTGELKVTNHTTKETAVLTFKESGYFSGTKNEVVGYVLDGRGQKQRALQGRWSESMMEEVAPNKLERIWKCNPPPPNHDRYYGFTTFTTQLNEMTEGLERQLPKTDTRFRPDQSLFERGLVDEADREKLRVEQRQRELRKSMEQRGEPWEVRWFEKRADSFTEDAEGATWQYKGGYWEAREAGAWNEKIALW